LSRLLARLQRQELEAQQARAVARALAEGEAAQAKPVASPADLRGIPVVGRGVAGAIRGTRPGQNLR